MSPKRDRQGRWLAAGVAAVALLIYLATLAPGLTSEHYGTDGGDLIAAARTLGIPHPTGYPLYTLAAWFFSQLPVGTVAYRVNLLSAACAAGAVGLLCRTVQILLADEEHVLLLSAAAALTLAFSPLLWSQAVISEVYTMLTLLAALVLWLLVRWRAGGGDGLLWTAALVLGLGIGNHLTLLVAAPAALILLWDPGPSGPPRWFRVRTVLPAIGFFLAGVGIYAYLPLAASSRPAVNWGNPQTLKGFLWVITAKQYQTFAFGLDPADILNRLGFWANLVGNQFGWWGLVLALAGAWWWWKRDRRLLLFTLAWMVLVGIYAFFYDTYDSHIYMLPTLLLLALWWVAGVRYVLRLLRPHRIVWQRLFLAGVLALPLLSLALNWREADLSQERQAHTYMQQALGTFAQDGLVVVRGDGPTFALWYGVYAEERRPDVAVVSGPMLAFIWYRDHVRNLYPDLIVNPPPSGEVTWHDLVHDLIEQNMSHRPVYATDPAEEWNDWFEFIEVGQAPVFRVERQAGP